MANNEEHAGCLRCSDVNNRATKCDTYTAKLSRKKLPLKEKFKLWWYTLFYHHWMSYEYALDVAVEPLYWFVDHFTHLLGPGFVTVVIVLIGSIVWTAHFLGIPFWMNKSPELMYILIVLGYWIIVNIVFNFYKTATTSPGHPTDVLKLAKCSVTICKKCITPKPPRTHHCSICNKCYLNMDHHCPWVNNCIGHFNRRYFFLTMVYIVAGCCYIMLFGVELGFREIILHQNILADCSEVSGEPVPSIFREKLFTNTDFGGIESEELIDKCDDSVAVLFLDLKISRRLLHLIIYFAGLLCIGASLALGGLSLWHAKLITMGETSIEYHTNRSERKKIGSTFVNVYDLGKFHNWETFLGLDQPNVSFVRNILFPSNHAPRGDGYDWSHITLRTVNQHLAHKS